MSPDGNRIAFATYARDLAKRLPYSQLQRIVELRTGEVTTLGLGVDGYWSPDGERLIYMSLDSGGISVRAVRSGATYRRVAPDSVGDYYSWGAREGSDIILTAQGNYFVLRDSMAERPFRRLPVCDGIGAGERPLLSKEARRATVFSSQRVFVRNLLDCDDVIDTGIDGAKADFAWGGRYIAMHALKPATNGYEVKVVDLSRRLVRTIAFPEASVLFPSWTRDGRLSFRYDGPDFRGFMMAENVLSLPASPLPVSAASPLGATGWDDLFPNTPRPVAQMCLVVIWSAWSAHAPFALDSARFVAERLRDSSVSVYLAADPGSDEADLVRMLTVHGGTLPLIRLESARFALTDAKNQIPTILLFRDGRLIGRRLGAQGGSELLSWIAENR